jgi:hypothetical protein
LERARQRKLFDGYNIYVTKHIQPDTSVMQRIITACGGTVSGRFSLFFLFPGANTRSTRDRYTPRISPSSPKRSSRTRKPSSSRASRTGASGKVLPPHPTTARSTRSKPFCRLRSTRTSSVGLPTTLASMRGGMSSQAGLFFTPAAARRDGNPITITIFLCSPARLESSQSLCRTACSGLEYDHSDEL